MNQNFLKNAHGASSSRKIVVIKSDISIKIIIKSKFPEKWP